jgi:hypothetical protein
MFGEVLFSASRHVRAGAAQIFSEFVRDLRAAPQAAALAYLALPKDLKSREQAAISRIN